MNALAPVIEIEGRANGWRRKDNRYDEDSDDNTKGAQRCAGSFHD